MCPCALVRLRVPCVSCMCVPAPPGVFLPAPHRNRFTVENIEKCRDDAMPKLETDLTSDHALGMALC